MGNCPETCSGKCPDPQTCCSKRSLKLTKTVINLIWAFTFLLSPGIGGLILFPLGWVDRNILVFLINHIVVSISVLLTLVLAANEKFHPAEEKYKDDKEKLDFLDKKQKKVLVRWKYVDETAMAFARTFLWYNSMVYGLFCLVHLHDWDRKASAHGLLLLGTLASFPYVRVVEFPNNF